jgi:solute carrier family 8 (sodium/calcium exchanger)
MWTQHTEAILATIGGDTRCDSPGHCASFGSYTILDSASHLILAQETCDRGEDQLLVGEGGIREMPVTH